MTHPFSPCVVAGPPAEKASRRLRLQECPGGCHTAGVQPRHTRGPFLFPCGPTVRGALAAGLFLTPLGTAETPAPVPLERDFLIRTWRPENGLPDHRVQALLSARNGFLWLGTRKGVSRFDGSRFLTWSRPTHAVFTSEDCRALAEDRDGVIWVGTWGGVIQLTEPPRRHDPMEIRPAPAPVSRPALNQIRSLCATDAGELLVGTTVGMVTRSPDGTWGVEDTQETAGFGPIMGFATQADGSLWVGTTHQLFRRERPGGPWVSELEGGNDPNTRCVHSLARTSDGVLYALVGSRDQGWGRLLRRSATGWQPVVERGFKNSTEPLFLTADANGGLWFPTTGSLIGCWHDGRLTEYALPASLGSDIFECLAEDAEGNLWAGTARHGLLCLQPRRIRTLRPEDGLPDPQTWTLLQATDRALWVGTDGGAVRFPRTADGGFARGARLVPGKIRALTEDAQGRIWVGTGSGLHRWDGRELTRIEYPGEPHRHKLRALHTGQDGAVWAGTAQGLHRFRPDETNAWSVADGLPHENVCVILEDRQRRVWIGTDGGGLARWTPDGFERFDEARGLLSLRVWALHEDADSALWIGTDRGLNVLQGDRLFGLTTCHGLPDNLVNGLHTDLREGLWVGHDRGIYRVNRRAVLDVVAGRRARVHCVTYTEADGLANTEVNGQISSPPVIGLRDGRVAFATMGGVALFDPAALPDLPNGPPVHLEELRAGGVVLLSGRPSSAWLRTNGGAGQPLRIGPRQRSVLDFRYTANSFRAPDQTQFRYRLLGLSPDWVGAGTLKQATYANLRPGAYTFEVSADNHQGYASARPARLDFVVEPTWHEHLAVRLAGALVLVFAVVGGVRARLRHLRRLNQLEQQAVLARHRARLAKDLHDGLGSSLTEITLLSGVGEPRSLPPEVMARRFDRLARSTHEALHALRDIIWSTTPKADSLAALVSRLCASVERATDAAGLRGRLDFPSELPAVALEPELRQDVLFAVNEAVHNAVRHAHATEISVRFAIEARRLVIEVKDNGRGFDLAEVERRPATPARGLGLASLRERLAAHAGACTIDSQPGHGTKVLLSVPLPAGPST
jgi:ligand-binding sensor domain-containing protein/signal transduction histidine kinase